MRNDYKMQGKLVQLNVEVEEAVGAILKEMEKHSKLSASELTNVALKRFITHHKDFLPQTFKMPALRQESAAG